MNTGFLIPFICLCICLAWSYGAKASSMNYDYIPVYHTPLYTFLQFALAICILVGIIIAGVNLGFLMGLAYFGITIGTVLLSLFIIVRLLIAAFSNQGLGAVLPVLCGIASAIWMFVNMGTF